MLEPFKRMKGTYQYPDGSVYKGEWNNQGQREGYGVMKFTDDSKYLGMFRAGLSDGHGSMIFSDNSRYDGEFRQGKFNGYGVFIRCDCMKFEGEFRDGSIFGLGLVTFADGSHGLPRNEGFFEGSKFVRREKCSSTIQLALEAADTARKLNS